MTSIRKVEQISLLDILLATETFDKKNFIAVGGFGNVYKGHSEQYGTIAVKRLMDHGIGKQGQHEFMMEISLLSAYKHANLVSLVGFCDEGGEKILVYKHESNGSLDKHLQSKDLNWIQRLRICLDAAKGLKYLHHDVGHQHRVVHRDVKSSNILLDEKMRTKISDFGLSKISPTNVSSIFLISNVCGTMGYIDPEYYIYGVLTEKSDVYYFGVVLFEVLCGRLARVVEYEDRRQFLCILAQNHFDKNTLHEIIYPNLQDQIDPVSLKTFSTIAYNCLTKCRKDRPSMSQIVEQLQKALDEQLAASSGDAALHQGHPTSHRNEKTQSGYRGEDTCMTFVDDLYSALVQQGIRTYLVDQILPRGTAIAPLLLKAIEESRIAVIMLTENYAGSSWCLEELSHVIKCKDERGQTVMPIFYHVDPSQVQKQKGKFGKALAKHELENKNVESWRKALTDVGNISGWETKYIANGNEAGQIELIVDTISYVLFSNKNQVEMGIGPMKIPFRDLILATNKFSEANISGTTGFGTLYRGQSAQHGIILIKQFDHMNRYKDRQFTTEIEVLSNCKHENIVSLIGFCDESDEKILVYRYEKKGSLDRLLHNKDLTWIHRLRICLGAASGLKYLHDDVGPQHRVLHRNVRSANILLDENWKPKISDFGLSKIVFANRPLSTLISDPCGTPEYIDPQYKEHSKLSYKSDVYSFGVVLFEVLFSRVVTFAEHPDENHFSVEMAKRHYEQKTLEEMIDATSEIK